MAWGWVWWGLMLCITLFNVVVLLKSRRLGSIVSGSGAEVSPALRTAAWIFTIVCGYRAVLPRVDVQRLCWFDTPLNWTIFGRISATVAEVAWAVQFGIQTDRLAQRLLENGKIERWWARCARYSKITVIGMACTAECCSWTNLISENNLFAVIEQALWSGLFGITAAAIGLLVWRWKDRPLVWWVFVVVVAGMAIEQGFESLGLYLPRYVDDTNDGKEYFAFSQGLRRLCECNKTSTDISDWADDAPWMTGYFSLGVWSSIWLSVAALPVANNDNYSKLAI